MSNTKISMKLLIDKSKRKVLFAEAGKECVDFFFHILSLPLGTIVTFLTKESMVGSIGGLYESLESLGTDYLHEGVNKDCLLNPKPAIGSASNVPILTINQTPDDPNIKKFFACTRDMYVSDGEGAECPDCNGLLSRELKYLDPPAAKKRKAQSSSSVGGYVKGVVTYMIMDDLSVKPMSMISSISLLNKFSIQDVGSLEERQVTLDMDLGVAMLKASLISKTVLTDVFLSKKSAGVVN